MVTVGLTVSEKSPGQTNIQTNKDEKTIFARRATVISGIPDQGPNIVNCQLNAHQLLVDVTDFTESERYAWSFNISFSND